MRKREGREWSLWHILLFNLNSTRVLVTIRNNILTLAAWLWYQQFSHLKPTPSTSPVSSESKGSAHFRGFKISVTLYAQYSRFFGVIVNVVRPLCYQCPVIWKQSVYNELWFLYNYFHYIINCIQFWQNKRKG